MTGTAVLVLNCGSSSVKFALVDPPTGRRHLSGEAERVGTPDVSLVVVRDGRTERSRPADGSVHGILVAILDAVGRVQDAAVAAVGHRVVHGGARFSSSALIDEATTEAIAAVCDLAPLHNPANLAGIRAVAAVLPEVPQVAVFDTAFHQSMPPRAYRYAVPRQWYDDLAVRRYGFHGTSHRYVSGRAAELLGRPLEQLRLVTAHLGNGCSATAVRDGRSVDTTMGLTPLAGLVMGTRSGDVDPGLLPYVADRTGSDVAQVLERLEHPQRPARPVRGEQRPARGVRRGRSGGRPTRRSPSTCSPTGWPRTSPRWWCPSAGSTRSSSPAGSASTALPCAAPSSTSWAFSVCARTRRPTRSTAATPAAGSARPGRPRRWSSRPTRSWSSPGTRPRSPAG